MPENDNRGRYDRKPVQIVRMKATFVRSRIQKQQAKLAEDQQLLKTYEDEVKRLVREEQLGTTTSQPSVSA